MSGPSFILDISFVLFLFQFAEIPVISTQGIVESAHVYFVFFRLAGFLLDFSGFEFSVYCCSILIDIPEKSYVDIF